MTVFIAISEIKAESTPYEHKKVFFLILYNKHNGTKTTIAVICKMSTLYTKSTRQNQDRPVTTKFRPITGPVTDIHGCLSSGIAYWITKKL